MRVAIAAEASQRGVPYDVVAKEWIERDLKDKVKLAKKNWFYFIFKVIFIKFYCLNDFYG